MQDIEEAKQYLDDYEEWSEERGKADKSEYVSPYSESVRGKESEITVEADKKSGRVKEKLFQRKKQKSLDRKQ